VSNDPDLHHYVNKYHDGSTYFTYNPDTSREMWSLRGGLDLLITGLLQGCLSYTYMDPGARRWRSPSLSLI
jgi:hypothetical protein